jgi:hypothetical protein
MSHPESVIAGFYDHEQDPSGGRGRGRREAPDWGGDDLFTGTPRRRRFNHSGARPDQAARRGETMEHPLQRGSSAITPPRAEARRVARHLDLGTIADVMAPVETESVAIEAPVFEAALAEPVVQSASGLAPATPEVEAHIARTEAPVRTGRRTVTVTGHPDRMPIRRRPAPTVDQRIIGSRPDRIAAYAFAMGLLLILIAFLSAHA